MDKIRITSNPTKVIDDGKVAYRYKAKVDVATTAKDVEVTNVYTANNEMLKRGLGIYNSMSDEEKQAMLKSMAVPK
jgi:hypothetical protein